MDDVVRHGFYTDYKKTLIYRNPTSDTSAVFKPFRTRKCFDIPRTDVCNPCPCCIRCIVRSLIERLRIDFRLCRMESPSETFWIFTSTFSDLGLPHCHLLTILNIYLPFYYLYFNIIKYCIICQFRQIFYKQ